MFLIIGGGGSWVIASIEASKYAGLKIILASRGPIGRSGLTPTANRGSRATSSVDEMFKEIEPATYLDSRRKDLVVKPTDRE